MIPGINAGASKGQDKTSSSSLGLSIRLWKGYHCSELRSLIADALTHNQLLILCPPFLRDLTFVRHLPGGNLEFRGEWGPEAQSTDHFLKNKNREIPLYPERPILGVFTSGTVSGVPRLVLYSRKNIQSSIDSILEVFDCSQIQTVFCYPQPFHTFGLILGYVLSIWKNYELITETGRYSTSFHDLRTQIQNEKLLTLGTPTHFHDLIQYVRSKNLKLKPSYSSIIGGAPVSASLWREIRDVLNIQKPSIGYGATEASPGIAHHPPGREPTEDGEIGFEFKQLAVRIQKGRGLEFSGPSLCLAMIQNEKLEFPQSVLISDEIRKREDGMLIYQGRTELIINRGGQKLSLEHMEDLVRRQLGLEIVCVSLSDPRLGEDLGVLVCASVDLDKSQSCKQVHEMLSTEFGNHFSFKNFVAFPEIPMTDNLKVDRKTATALVSTVRSKL